MKMGCAMVALVGSAALVGCDFPQREALVENPWSKPGQPGVVTMPGELRAAYIAGGKDAVLRYCAEPAPDTAAQAALKVATAIEASGKSTSAAEGSAKINNNVEYAVTVLELAGRTQAVLLTRELAYRVCEARLNGIIDEKAAHGLLWDVIQVSRHLAEAEQKKAEAKKEEAEAKKTEADAALKEAEAELIKAKLSKLPADQQVRGAEYIKGCSSVRKECQEKADKLADKAKKDAATKECSTAFEKCVDDELKTLGGGTPW
jgi:hypothetical protein